MKDHYLIKLFAAVLIFASICFGQSPEKPKLVVGIVVDQMRYDYLTRFEPYFGKDGFNRLLNQGTDFTYAHFNYVPTYTGPGHTSVYTGTTPFYHGIIANDWYDKFSKEMVYCAEDTSVSGVGTDGKEGKMSPGRMFTTTITDQLKLATNFKSKVISISIKDRASILPGGHTADAAYWYDHENGNFITSTYYMNELPRWMKDFNNKKLASQYLSKNWELLKPKKDYEISSPDNVKWERDVFKEGKTSFPHSLKNLDEKEKLGYLPYTPFGNQILIELAKAALQNENLGKHNVTDFLAISFSAPDYIGHSYGPNSWEVEDTYLRLDKQLAELFAALDKQVGKGNYLLFLTADHAVSEVQEFVKEHKIPAGELGYKNFLDSLYSFCAKEFGGKEIIANSSNRQLFLNYDYMKRKNINPKEAAQKIVYYLRQNFPQMAAIFTRSDFQGRTAERNSTNLVLNGFNPTRSGDIAYELQPYFLPNYMKQGTAHGTVYNYDTHVPMLFYGWNIPKQKINTPVYTIDIAPTIANLLNITEPNGCLGIPLLHSAR